MSENIGQFVSAAAQGDTDAMAKLYSKTLKASYFLAEVLTADSVQAAEITKKAYARAFCTVGKLKKPEAFEIWMKQTVASVYKETQRFVFNDAEAGAGESSTEFLPEEVYDDPARSAAALEAVAALKPELRTALVLHYNNGMPVQIIAKFLGVSESTANALLCKARASVALSLGVERSGSASDTLPVLSRIFRRAAAEAKIDNSLVRDIFLFAIDAYNAVNASSAKEEEPQQPAPAQEEAPESEEQEPETAEETEQAEEAETVEEVETVEETEQPEETVEIVEEETVVEVPPSEPEAQSGNVISFKQKIDEILSGEQIPAAADNYVPESVREEAADEDEDDGLAVPPFLARETESTPLTDEELDAFNDEPVTVKTEEVKKPTKKFDFADIINKIKKLTPKNIAIIAAAVVVVILAIFGISKLAGKGGDSGNVNADAAAYKWVAGGFEECESITYLNEKCCMFKSKTTGKYGLLDYQGNVILQPNYDEFKVCGSGRDHSSRGSYHALVKIGNDYFEVTFTDGVPAISSTPHAAHSIVTDELPDNAKYDERDRYFEGYAAARKDGKWGYVSQDKDKKVIPYEYEAVNTFDDITMLSCDYCRSVSGGLIPVKKDGKMGIIDLKNNTVVPFEYTDILEGEGGVFIAQKNGVWGVILTGDAVNTFTGVNIVVQVTPEAPTGPNGSEGEKYRVNSDEGANVRSDAGADYDKLGELNDGDEVTVFTTKTADNGKRWACIDYKGEYGWVAMVNLEKVDA